MDRFDELIKEMNRLGRIIEARQKVFDNEEFKNKNFDNDNGRCPVLKKAKAYADNWQTMKDKNCGLIFLGDVGTGKTFAAACIANALTNQGISVRMTSFNNALKAVFAAEDKEKVFDELCSYELLILDDFGAERDTSYAVEQLYNLIDKRYISGKPLIITTNLTYRELKKPEDMSYKRIYDRILEMCVAITFRGENMRRAISEEKLSLMMSLLEEPDEVKNESCESTGGGEEEPKVVEQKVFYGRMTPKSKDFEFNSKTEKETDHNSRENAVNKL